MNTEQKTVSNIIKIINMLNKTDTVFPNDGAMTVEPETTEYKKAELDQIRRLLVEVLHIHGVHFTTLGWKYTGVRE